MKRFMVLLLISSYAVTQANYYIFHLGTYAQAHMIPAVNGYTIMAESHKAKRFIAGSCASLAAVIIARLTYNKYKPKRKMHCCMNCLNDLSKWELLDYSIMIGANDCFVCSINEI